MAAMEKENSIAAPAGTESGSSRFPDGFRIMQGTQEYITYLDHSSIRVWYSDVPAHFDMHSHSAVEIILPQKGVPVYHLKDKDYAVQPGEILIIPSDCPHALTEPEDLSRHLLLFEPGPLTLMRDLPNLSEMMRQPILLRGHSEWQQAVGRLLMQVVDCYFRKEPLWNTECYSYLMKAYALLGRYHLRIGTPPRHAGSRKIESAIMNSAITFINEHYMEDISLEDVAVFAGFSKCYFSRLFKQFCSLSFSEFLTRKRLNVAAELLIHTRLPVKEIVVSSGFGSIAAFNRVFKAHKQCTPTQYRLIYGSGILPDVEGCLF